MRAFLVTNNRLHICTVIGAENSHHASNKATKLWGNNWDLLELVSTPNMYPKFIPLKEFNRQIKKLSETTEKETNK